MTIPALLTLACPHNIKKSNGYEIFLKPEDMHYNHFLAPKMLQ
jgi:hypothetical protein